MLNLIKISLLFLLCCSCTNSKKKTISCVGFLSTELCKEIRRTINQKVHQYYYIDKTTREVSSDEAILGLYSLLKDSIINKIENEKSILSYYIEYQEYENNSTFRIYLKGDRNSVFIPQANVVNIFYQKEHQNPQHPTTGIMLDQINGTLLTSIQTYDCMDMYVYRVYLSNGYITNYMITKDQGSGSISY
ncbi:hypothetical protein V9L05_01625 [Bernardetia sp. Wsw4-3y2]|uniref:hypothetical protein n=1 Tax=Bernardetia sp. Wsw4-3y2 TaxID=3127471 RepID=UPI0030CC6E04